MNFAVLTLAVDFWHCQRLCCGEIFACKEWFFGPYMTFGSCEKSTAKDSTAKFMLPHYVCVCVDKLFSQSDFKEIK